MASVYTGNSVWCSEWTAIGSISRKRWNWLKFSLTLSVQSDWNISCLKRGPLYLFGV